jgi:hypothetical protein
VRITGLSAPLGSDSPVFSPKGASRLNLEISTSGICSGDGLVEMYSGALLSKASLSEASGSCGLAGEACAVSRAGIEAGFEPSAVGVDRSGIAFVLAFSTGTGIGLPSFGAEPCSGAGTESGGASSAAGTGSDTGSELESGMDCGSGWGAGCETWSGGKLVPIGVDDSGAGSSSELGGGCGVGSGAGSSTGIGPGSDETTGSVTGALASDDPSEVGDSVASGSVGVDSEPVSLVAESGPSSATVSDGAESEETGSDAGTGEVSDVDDSEADTGTEADSLVDVTPRS